MNFSIRTSLWVKNYGTDVCQKFDTFPSFLVCTNSEHWKIWIWKRVDTHICYSLCLLLLTLSPSFLLDLKRKHWHKNIAQWLMLQKLIKPWTGREGWREGRRHTRRVRCPLKQERERIVWTETNGKRDTWWCFSLLLFTSCICSSLCILVSEWVELSRKRIELEE